LARIVLLDFGVFVFICGSGWSALGDFYRGSFPPTIAFPFPDPAS
jgi:hypothetical protein